MSKKMKIYWDKWRKMLKSAFLTTLVLAAIAVCYGYYLVERISDDYNQAQSTIAETVSNDALADTNKEKLPEAVYQEKPTIEVQKSAETAEDSTTENNSATAPEETAEPKNVENNSIAIAQGQAQLISYEAVGAAGYTDLVPCNIKAVYEYGYGYDPIYKDIRFHDHALYQAEESFGVQAVADGSVEEIAKDADGVTITLRHEWGLSEYGGVDECTLSKGANVSAGENIATATKLNYKLWAKN